MARTQHLHHYVRLVAATVILTVAVVVAGCARPASNAPAKKPLDVTVVLPLMHKITRSEDFTGRTEPFRYVEIRPQVTGELKAVHFKDGDNVREGALLFEIDPRLYIAQRNTAEAAIAKAKAVLAQAEADLERARVAFKKKVNAEADLDAAIATRDAAIASVGSANAALELADLNLVWTKINAQYSGRLSMRRVDPGNIVTANTTVLTTLIVLNPMYIGFDIDEQAVERRREAIKAGEIPSARNETLLVEVGLGHQENYPYRATVTFSDNQLDPGTGTLHIRAEMENPTFITQHLSSLSAVVGLPGALEAERKSLRLLSPNMFVRVRMPFGRPYEALLVREEAINSDQGHKFVYIVNDDNVVEKRRVKPGPLYHPSDPLDTRVFRSIEDWGWFDLTDEAFTALRNAKVPDAVLAKLSRLKNKELPRGDFVKEITKCLNAYETRQFQDSILKNAEERTTKTPKSDGVARGDRVVFGGQQRIKEGDKVNLDPNKQPTEKPIDGQ